MTTKLIKMAVIVRDFVTFSFILKKMNFVNGFYNMEPLENEGKRADLAM